MKTIKLLTMIFVSLTTFAFAESDVKVGEKNQDQVASKASTDGWLAYTYIIDQNNAALIKVVDLRSKSVVDSIPYPGNFATGNEGLVLNANADTLVATNFNTVFTYKISERFGQTATISNFNPALSAVTPDGSVAYVISSESLYAFHITNGTYFGSIINGTLFQGLGITPNGKKLYVLDNNSSDISIIDTKTNTVIGTVDPAGYNLLNPFQIAMNPNGKLAYVTSSSNGEVSILNLENDKIIGVFNLGPDLGDIVVTFDGKYAFVKQSFSDIIPIDITTNQIRPAISGFNDLSKYPITVSPDSKTIYVTDVVSSSPVIIPIDVATMTKGDPIYVNDSQTGQIFCIAITPDQAPTARFVTSLNDHSHKAKGIYRDSKRCNRTVTFDASSSTSPVGTIVNYFWDFGDGSTVSTSSPIVEHTFNQRKSTVTLTVTNSAGTSTSQTYTGLMVGNNGGPSAITSQIVKLKKRSCYTPNFR